MMRSATILMLATGLAALAGPLGSDSLSASPVSPPAQGQAGSALALSPAAAEAEDTGLDGLPGQELPDPASVPGLVLSPEQKDKLKVLRQAGYDKQRAHAKRLRELVQVLDGQVQAKASDGDLSATLESLKAEHRAQELDRGDALDQAEAVLSPSQAAQYVLHVRDKVKEGLKRWKAKRDK